MNLLELAQKRCSIRKYASSPVEDEKLAYTWKPDVWLHRQSTSSPGISS